MIGRLSSFVSPCVLDISWISNSPTWQFCHLLGLTWLVLEITSQYFMLCLLSLFISMLSCHNHPGTLDLSGWTPCSPTSSGASPWLFCFAPHYSPPASKLASGKSCSHYLPSPQPALLCFSDLNPRPTNYDSLPDSRSDSHLMFNALELLFSLCLKIVRNLILVFPSVSAFGSTFTHWP